APGVADSLAPPAASVRSKPLAYGASPDLAGLLVRTSVGPTVVAFDPWRPIDGRGHRRDLEAARADFLERYGFVGGVRTHTNAAAEALRERDAAPAEPRGVLRVRPAPTKDDNDASD